MPAAFLVVVVLLVGIANIPAIAYPVGVALFVVYLLLMSAPDRRAARARKSRQ